MALEKSPGGYIFLGITLCGLIIASILKKGVFSLLIKEISLLLLNILPIFIIIFIIMIITNYYFNQKFIEKH
jgi:uncharacterized membrane protein